MEEEFDNADWWRSTDDNDRALKQLVDTEFRRLIVRAVSALKRDKIKKLRAVLSRANELKTRGYIPPT